jgi:hypothetical protein
MLALQRKCLIANETLEMLCRTLFYKDIHPDAIDHLNVHSKGTIVEALIEKCKNRHGEVFALQKLDVLFVYMQQSLPLSLIHEVTTSTLQLDVDEEHNIEDQFRQQLTKQIKKDTPSPAVVSKKVMAPCITASRQSAAQFVIDTVDEECLAAGSSFTHSAECMDVMWKSRKKYSHVDKFYSCCGSPVSSTGVYFQPVCPRSTWANPLSFHPGKLVVVCSKKMGGGCGPRGGDEDHIPTSKEPTWDCCQNRASAEGCVSSVLVNDTTPPVAKEKNPLSNNDDNGSSFYESIYNF